MPLRSQPNERLNAGNTYLRSQWFFLIILCAVIVTGCASPLPLHPKPQEPCVWVEDREILAKEIDGYPLVGALELQHFFPRNITIKDCIDEGTLPPETRDAIDSYYKNYDLSPDEMCILPQKYHGIFISYSLYMYEGMESQALTNSKKSDHECLQKSDVPADIWGAATLAAQEGTVIPDTKNY